MDEQLPLFDVPPSPPVAGVTRPAPRGRVRFRRLTLCVRVLCDDCTLALQLAGWRGPAPLPAAWERLGDGAAVRLCHPHYQSARADERVRR